jgi:thymidylate synthase (FAD)
MQKKIKVLDHGFVRLVDRMGSDQSIIEAARESTSKGFEGWGPFHEDGCAYKESLVNWMTAEMDGQHPEMPDDTKCTCKPKAGDEKLLAYLYDNRHDTPFEMAEMVFQVQAPLFVFREWHRHRTQSYNEMSARYAPLPDVNYVPTVERLMLGGGHLTKQAASAAGAAALTLEEAGAFQYALKQSYKHSEALYQSALKSGVPKELARCALPVGRYSRMRAKGNLRNWLGFLTLRSDQNAQYEIRAYAYAVGHLISKAFPRTWDLFLNHARKPPVIDAKKFDEVEYVSE